MYVLYIYIYRLVSKQSICTDVLALLTALIVTKFGVRTRPGMSVLNVVKHVMTTVAKQKNLSFGFHSHHDSKVF